jgi:hypothetical protein
MGSHDPFGHLKHKLWPKERSGIKLAIWFPTTKHRESTRFPCVKVACNTLLESSRRRLQLCLKPHPDRRSAHKVIALQSCNNFNFGNFGIPIWESWHKKAIWMWASWRGIEYTVRGKVVTSPKSRPRWVLWVQVYSWLVLAPKVLP